MDRAMASRAMAWAGYVRAFRCRTEGFFFVMDDAFWIQVDELTHVYQAGTDQALTALDGVSLRVGAGELVAVVGANGSGKSTLVRHLNGLLLPTSGRVQVVGLDTADRAQRQRIRGLVGMVFQVPEDQLVATVAQEDVAFGPENLGVPPDQIPGRVRQALESVGMWGERHRPTQMLSPGQQQRLAIAGALAMGPRCLVLDEATAMLDPQGRQALWQVVAALHEQRLTVIYVTHDMDEAARAERIVALHQGQVVADGAPRQVFGQRQRLATWGLGLPTVTAAAQALGIQETPLTADELFQALAAAPRPQVQGAALPPDRADQLSEPWIAVEGLSHFYGRGTPFERQALADVDFEVGAGEAVGLIGETGSGKSTLLQHLNGLYRPQTGRVLVLGRELGDPNVDLRAVRQQVGLAFQRPEQQLFEQYVGDDVAYGPRNMGLSGEALREAVRWAMEAVGLDFAGFKDRLTWRLSGGQRRKVALAGVLALRPKVLVLDEPTAGLDPASRLELLALLRALHGQGMALVVASHNMADMAALTERLTVLQGGRVVATGPTAQVLAEREALLRWGLDTTPAAQVAHELGQLGLALDGPVATLDELGAALAAWLAVRP